MGIHNSEQNIQNRVLKKNGFLCCIHLNEKHLFGFLFHINQKKVQNELSENIEDKKNSFIL